MAGLLASKCGLALLCAMVVLKMSLVACDILYEMRLWKELDEQNEVNQVEEILSGVQDKKGTMIKELSVDDVLKYKDMSPANCQADVMYERRLYNLSFKTGEQEGSYGIRRANKGVRLFGIHYIDELKAECRKNMVQVVKDAILRLDDDTKNFVDKNIRGENSNIKGILSKSKQLSDHLKNYTKNCSVVAYALLVTRNDGDRKGPPMVDEMEALGDWYEVREDCFKYLDKYQVDDEKARQIFYQSVEKASGKEKAGSL